MKNYLIAIASLFVAGLIVAADWPTLSVLELDAVVQDPSLVLDNQPLLLSVYLVLVSLLLLSGRRERVAVVSEATKVEDTQESVQTHSELLYFLSLLQEKGRLLDFVMDDVTPYSDEQVGQVARVVHKGVREALSGTIEIESLHQGEEGDTISVDQGFSSEDYRFVGSVKERPPFSGRVLHRGWRAKNITMPSSTTSSSVVQPVELEVD